MARYTDIINNYLFDEKADFLFENILTNLRLSIAQNLPI